MTLEEFDPPTRYHRLDPKQASRLVEVCTYMLKPGTRASSKCHSRGRLGATDSSARRRRLLRHAWNGHRERQAKAPSSSQMCCGYQRVCR